MGASFFSPANDLLHSRASRACPVSPCPTVLCHLCFFLSSNPLFFLSRFELHCTSVFHGILHVVILSVSLSLFLSLLSFFLFLFFFLHSLVSPGTADVSRSAGGKRACKSVRGGGGSSFPSHVPSEEQAMASTDPRMPAAHKRKAEEAAGPARKKNRVAPPAEPAAGSPEDELVAVTMQWLEEQLTARASDTVTPMEERLTALNERIAPLEQQQERDQQTLAQAHENYVAQYNKHNSLLQQRMQAKSQRIIEAQLAGHPMSPEQVFKDVVLPVPATLEEAHKKHAECQRQLDRLQQQLQPLKAEQEKAKADLMDKQESFKLFKQRVTAKLAHALAAMA